MNDDALTSPNLLLNRSRSERGMTLVELMIVVAIVGVLASIAIVSYNSYVEEAHLTEMRQYAQDVERGQEDFHSRHGTYLDPTEYDGEREYEHGDDAWAELLQFDHELPEQFTIETDGGGPDDNCDVTNCSDADPSNEDVNWFAVRVEYDDLSYDIFYTSELSSPIEVEPAND